MHPIFFVIVAALVAAVGAVVVVPAARALAVCSSSLRPLSTGN